jgi:hypothetical protein
MIDNREHTIYLYRRDGILGVDTVNGAMHVYPLPAVALLTLEYDSQSQVMYGVTLNGVDTIDLGTGMTNNIIVHPFRSKLQQIQSMLLIHCMIYFT